MLPLFLKDITMLVENSRNYLKTVRNNKQIWQGCRHKVNIENSRIFLSMKCWHSLS